MTPDVDLNDTRGLRSKQGGFAQIRIAMIFKMEHLI